MNVRRAGLLAAGVGVLLLTPTSPALAADAQVSVVGGAAVPTHAPSKDQITYTISVGDDPIDDAVAYLYEPPAVPADPASVVVDGKPVARATVDRAGAGLVVRLGAHADGEHGGRLGVGNHTVTVDLAVERLPTGRASARAVIDWVAAGRTRHVSSRPVGLALPDLRLRRLHGSGERHTLPLGTGVDGEFEVLLANPGGGVGAATLELTLPTGLVVDHGLGVYRDDQYRNPADPGGRRLHCGARRDNVVRCNLGAVGSGTDALIDIAVRPLATAPAGHVGTFGLAALPEGRPDARPGDNAVSGSVRFTGTAHLVVSLGRRALRVPVGGSGRLTVTVHNQGPDRALRTLGLLELRGDHFTITGFTGKQGSVARGVPLVLWKAGTIRPGGRARAVLTVRARVAGRDQLRIGVDSAAGDPPCRPEVPSPRCDEFAVASLHAVARRSAAR